MPKKTPTDALAAFLEANLSRHQYDVMRQLCPETLPCYSLLQREKKTCYTPEEARTVTEDIANIKLQAILDLTASRLAIFLDEQLKSLSQSERTKGIGG